VQLLPGFEYQAFGAVFAVETGFFFFEDAEGFAGEVFPVDIELGTEKSIGVQLSDIAMGRCGQYFIYIPPKFTRFRL